MFGNCGLVEPITVGAKRVLCVSRKVASCWACVGSCRLRFVTITSWSATLQQLYYFRLVFRRYRLGITVIHLYSFPQPVHSIILTVTLFKPRIHHYNSLHTYTHRDIQRYRRADIHAYVYTYIRTTYIREPLRRCASFHSIKCYRIILYVEEFVVISGVFSVVAFLWMYRDVSEEFVSLIL
jgi:hypothetical protein